MQKKLVAASVLALAGVPAFATGVDLTSLTAAVDLSTVIPAILAVGALLMAPAVAKYAVSSIRRMFPR